MSCASPSRTSLSGIRLAGHSDNLAALAQFVQMVGVPLHHLTSFEPALGSIVCAADLVVLDMCQLQLHGVGRPAAAIVRGRTKYRPESVRNVLVVFVANPSQRVIERIFVEWLRRLGG